MKKYLKTNVSAFALALALGTSGVPTVWAENIVYTGSAYDYNKFYNPNMGKVVIFSKTRPINNAVTVSGPARLDDNYKAADTVAGGV